MPPVPPTIITGIIGAPPLPVVIGFIMPVFGGGIVPTLSLIIGVLGVPPVPVLFTVGWPPVGALTKPGALCLAPSSLLPHPEALNAAAITHSAARLNRVKPDIVDPHRSYPDR
jgi:hypothetical protein